MHDIIVRQFALDIEKNTSEIARLSKQVRRLKRANVVCGAIAAGAVVYAVVLDNYLENEIRKLKEEEE